MARADYVKFVGKRKPPPDMGRYNKRPDHMTGPHAPDPKFPATLGKNPSKGQYRIPGLGQWGKEQNVRKNKNRHAFNPGRKTGNWS